MRRSRSPASSYCTASGRDSSDWDVWAFRAKLHLRSGTPCLVLEFSMAQTGSVFACDGYLHQSRLGQESPAAKGTETKKRAKAAPDRRQRALLLSVSGGRKKKDERAAEPATVATSRLLKKGCRF